MAAAPTPGDDVRARRIPEATVARLPLYLRCLLELAGTDVTTVSSERLADLCGVNAAKVRKDLSHLGSYGTRGVGYDVGVLLSQISRQLGLTQDWPIAIVGLGNLGHALANYRGFGARGFRIVGLFDADPARVGELVGGIPVRHVDDLPAVAAAAADRDRHHRRPRPRRPAGRRPACRRRRRVDPQLRPRDHHRPRAGVAPEGRLVHRAADPQLLLPAPPGRDGTRRGHGLGRRRRQSERPQYPVNLSSTAGRCLVVGGGAVARRKVDALLACGADVTVVAPDVDVELAARPVARRAPPLPPGEVAGYRLVMAATGDPEVANAAVYEDAEAAGVWVNAADDPDHCSFTLPSVARRGRPPGGRLDRREQPGAGRLAAPADRGPSRRGIRGAPQVALRCTDHDATRRSVDGECRLALRPGFQHAGSHPGR